MKALLNILLILFINSFLFAQVTTVNITENTTSDSLLMPLLGVISGPVPATNSKAPDITDKLQNIGITSIRNNDYYNDALDMEGIFNCNACSTYPCWNCDPEDENNYHWELSDSVFQSIIGGGFEPFFRIGGEYNNQLRNHDYKGPRANEEDNYIRAAKKVVDRYLHWKGSKGTFEYLDLWTEYPNTTFWDRSNKAFEQFWARLYDTLKTAFPQLKVGGPGLLFTLFIAKGVTDNHHVQEEIEFLNYLYEHNVKPDWIGWHLFHLEPADYYKAGVNMRHLLDGTDLFSFVPWAGTGFFKNTELICDAYYLSKIKVDSLGGNPVVLPAKTINKFFNRQEGSATLSGVWMNLQMTDIKRAYYYRANDVKSDPNLPLGNPDNMLSSGLFYGNEEATAKPVAYAFKLFSRLYKNYPYLLTTENFQDLGTRDSLRLLAAEDRKGNYAAFVSNVDSDNPVSFNLNIKGIPADTSHFNIKYLVVNNDENGDEPHSFNKNFFKLNSMNVMLIEFKKKSAVSVENVGSLPRNFSLGQNYPNPFGKVAPSGNLSTVIKYQIPQNNFVSLTVYNILGKQVARLVSKNQKAGKYRVKFDGANLPSGVYFYTLRAGDFVSTKKMLFIK